MGSAVFTCVMLIAGVLDLRSRRIPNALTVTGAATALVLRAPMGWEALADGVLGLGLALVLTFPLFALGALGGGDVKLLAAVGAFMGPVELIGACLLIALLGGALALFEATRKGSLRLAFLNVFYMLGRMVSPVRRQLAPTLTSPAAMAIPYGIPIAVGALIWWYWGSSHLWTGQ